MASRERNSTEKLQELLQNEREIVKSNVGEDPIRFRFNSSLRYGEEFYKKSKPLPKTIRFIGE